MGFNDSPYHTCQSFTIDMEILIYCREREDNIFIWLEVMLNLQGNTIYKLDHTWLSKHRVDGRIVLGLFIYVYSGIPMGPSNEHWCNNSRM